MGRPGVVHAPTWRAAFKVAVCAGLVVTSCTAARPSADRADQAVPVTERDFKISLAPVRLKAGEVDLAVHNEGPENHELIVVHDHGGALPMRGDGVTVNEEKLEPATVGGLEPGSAGAVRHLRLRLQPGRYQLFCNMAGHYMGGMHTELVVS